MNAIIKLLLWLSPAFLFATVVSYQIGIYINRRSGTETFAGIEWVVAASYLLLAGIFSPILALVFWIVHRGTISNLHL